MEGANATNATETNEAAAALNNSNSTTTAAAAASHKKSNQTTNDGVSGSNTTAATAAAPTTSHAQVATAMPQEKQTEESTVIDLNIIPTSSAKAPRKRKCAPKPGEPGYDNHLERGRLLRLKYKEIANQRARDEEAEQYRYRMNIARGYQLFSGAKLLEEAAGAAAAGHPIAKQHLSKTIKTMREEADKLWKTNEESFDSWEQTMLRLCKFMLQEGHMEISKSHPEKELHNFIGRQRREKRRLEKDPPTKEYLQEIYAHRIKVLNMIGYVSTLT